MHVSFVRCDISFRLLCSFAHLYSTTSRSTNLDSWQLRQLRTMKIGGNESATAFFTRNGGQALLGDSDITKNYASPAADRYKAELDKRVKEDEVRCVAITNAQGTY